MDKYRAQILLQNLLDRLEGVEDNGGSIFSGKITLQEIEAMRAGLAALETTQPAGAQGEEGPSPQTELASPPFSLNLSSLQITEARKGMQICMDFGTAMSKAALVIDGDCNAAESDIDVLPLGVIGEQQEISETMLISSVYIKNNGHIVFGKGAADASLVEHANGQRTRIDNIKRFLSEDGLDSELSENFNPTNTQLTGRHVVLAYLAFFAYTVNACLAKSGLDSDIERRYAMPCFPDPRSTQVSRLLKQMLGQAQVLADTFGERLLRGIPLAEFMAAVNALPPEASNWRMITHQLTEPLGVANSMFDEDANIDGVVAVIDVGAGTTDMSIYRVKKTPGSAAGVAYEAKGAARGIEKAGNYLDRLLRSYVLQRAGISAGDANYRAAVGRVDLTIRSNKEELFENGSVYIPTSDADGVTVTLDEFCELEPVREFSEALRNCMQEMMEQAPEDFMAVAEKFRAIRVVCSGGGATLPMIKALGTGSVIVQGHAFQLVSRENFPGWMEEKHEALRREFPRTAVAIGGARRNLIGDKGSTSVLAGGAKGEARLEGYYVEGR